MINVIIESISISLNAEFGDGYTNYTETVEQDLNEPCFLISCINPANRIFLGNRYVRENLFCIQYFPADRSRAKEECNDIAERLFSCLEYITLDGNPVRGTGMRCETVDDVLNFFVNYDLFVYKMTEPDAMAAMSQAVAAKG